MKKDVKKLLAEHRAEILPDERVKEKVKRDLGISSVTESRLSYAHGGERAVTDRRKATTAVIAVVLIAAVFLCIFLPLWLGRGGTSGTVTPPGGGIFGSITDAGSFYAYGAASVGSILSSAASGAAQTATEAGSAAESRAESASGSDAEQVATLNKYLSIVESLLSDGGITETAVAPAEGYAFGMNVVSTDLLGGTSSYTLYYNKQFVGASTDDDEREENYAIDGVLVVDGAEYPVTGNYQTETESGEQGGELFFRAYTSDDRRSYIEVRQEYETEEEGQESETEVEYVYTVRRDGETVERMTVEYEEENGELELMMTIERGGARETLYFEDETEGGERVIAVHGNLDGTPVSFRIYVREGEYHYVFGDGSEAGGDRPYDDDDDDDDDDRFDDD